MHLKSSLLRKKHLLKVQDDKVDLNCLLSELVVVVYYLLWLVNGHGF